jgi:hypothetical protein
MVAMPFLGADWIGDDRVRAWVGKRAWGQTFVFLSHLSLDDSVACRDGTEEPESAKVIRCFGVAGKQERGLAAAYREKA